MSLQKNTSWVLFGYPVLDDDFDADDGFESVVIDSINRCGTIDVHPNGWGVHDGMYSYSDGYPEDKRTPEEKAAREKWRRELRAKHKIERERERQLREAQKRRLERQIKITTRGNLRACIARFILDQDNSEFSRDPYVRSSLREALIPILMRLTGCDRIAAACAANEFMDFGYKSVDRSAANGGSDTWAKWFVDRIRGYRY